MYKTLSVLVYCSVTQLGRDSPQVVDFSVNPLSRCQDWFDKQTKLRSFIGRTNLEKSYSWSSKSQNFKNRFHCIVVLNNKALFAMFHMEHRLANALRFEIIFCAVMTVTFCSKLFKLTKSLLISTCGQEIPVKPHS